MSETDQHMYIILEISRPVQEFHLEYFSAENKKNDRMRASFKLPPSFVPTGHMACLKF